MVIEERVTNLEEVLAKFVSQTNLMLAAIHEEVAEMRASNARTDRRLLEMQQEADKQRELAERRHDLAERRHEQAEKQREQDRLEWKQYVEEAKAERRDFNKRMAELSDSMGTLIKDMVAPCGFQLAKAVFVSEEATGCGIRLVRKHPSKPGETMEIDLLATGQTKALAIEVKRHLDAAQAAEYLRKLEMLPEFFPEVRGKTIYPAVASVYLAPSLVKFLSRQKIYAVAMGDEVMEVVNLGQF